MLQRHRIFNQIIAYWVANDHSSTPRRGELLRWLNQHKMPMARKTLRDHLSLLVDEGFISIDEGTIILRRKEPIADPATNDASLMAAIQETTLALD